MSRAVVTVAEALADCSPVERPPAGDALAALLGVDRGSLYAHPGQPLPIAVTEHFYALLRARAGGMPWAYLTGSCGFWTLELEVDQHTLVPRPETERLVEAALVHIPLRCPARLADLGTGSGAVALALAAERPRAQLIATDSCARALRVARRNAGRAGLSRIHFRRGDWCHALGRTRLDLIVSNPPYVEAAGLKQSLRHEPRRALYGGWDGLDVIRHLVRECRSRLRRGGWLLLEHGAWQGARVRALYARHGYHHIRTLRDLAGHERVSYARVPG